MTQEVFSVFYLMLLMYIFPLNKGPGLGMSSKAFITEKNKKNEQTNLGVFRIHFKNMTHFEVFHLVTSSRINL